MATWRFGIGYWNHCIGSTVDKSIHGRHFPTNQQRRLYLHQRPPALWKSSAKTTPVVETDLKRRRFRLIYCFFSLLFLTSYFDRKLCLVFYRCLQSEFRFFFFFFLFLNLRLCLLIRELFTTSVWLLRKGRKFKRKKLKFSLLSYMRFGKIINTAIRIWWRCEIQSHFFVSVFSADKQKGY